MVMEEHDLVIYGASSFAGELLAAHLASHAPAGTRIALAGRSRQRLEAVRERLGRDWPVIVADAFDAAALAKLAASTRVVATTVGPYAKFGNELVDACAAAGTDYVDLTGEVLFARRSIAVNQERAAASGARIVHSCGWDSIPSDLAVHLLHKEAAEELTGTTMVVLGMRGGFSGGTIDSMRHQADTVRTDRDLRRAAARPYTLSPDLAAEPDLGRQEDFVTLPASEVDPALRGTLAPFFMASYNTRVVRRSNALRHYAYGRGFRYREVISTGSSALSPLRAAGIKLGLGGLMAGLGFGPTRAVLDRVLPAPGTGPGEKSRTAGFFSHKTFTTTASGKRLAVRFRMKGDPGYAATTVMLAECALALVAGEVTAPGGVWTPATAFGDALVGRLRAAGADIAIA
jgi:short subunit dehydrogenase-like uncharacterized protein